MDREVRWEPRENAAQEVVDKKPKGPNSWQYQIYREAEETKD